MSDFLGNEKNPFGNRKEVKDPTDFFGREKQIMEIVHMLIREQLQDCQLIGERRIGKTSLINYLFHPNGGLARFEESLLPRKSTDFMMVRVDLDYIRPSIDDGAKPNDLAAHLLFLNTLFSRLHGVVKNKFPEMENKELVDQLVQRYSSREMNDPAQLLNIDIWDYLTVLIKATNVVIVFVLDEADNMIIAGVGKYLRPLSAGFDKNLCFILITRLVFADLNFDNEVSPFFSHLKTIFMDLMSPTEAREMVVSRARTVVKTFSPSDLDFILEIGGCHPDFLNVAASYVYDNPECLTHVELYLKIRRELDSVCAVLWKSLSRLDGGSNYQSAAVQIALGKFTPKFSIDHEVLDVLKSRGFIHVDEDNHPRIFSRVFRDYILRMAERYGLIPDSLGPETGPSGQSYPVVAFNGLRITFRNQSVALTKTEKQIFSFLYDQCRVCTRDELFKAVRGEEKFSDNSYNTVSVAVSRLNRKLRDNHLDIVITSARSTGFYLEFGNIT